MLIKLNIDSFGWFVSKNLIALHLDFFFVKQKGIKLRTYKMIKCYSNSTESAFMNIKLAMSVLNRK